MRITPGGKSGDRAQRAGAERGSAATTVGRRERSYLYFSNLSFFLHPHPKKRYINSGPRNYFDCKGVSGFSLETSTGSDFVPSASVLALGLRTLEP